MNIKNKKICLIGLGYVGLPLVIAFAKKFEVTGLFSVTVGWFPVFLIGQSPSVPTRDVYMSVYKGRWCFVCVKKECGVFHGRD